jgi:SAM-dependent methyltransferase
MAAGPAPAEPPEPTTPGAPSEPTADAGLAAAASDPYAGARDHYTSRERRDWVKRAWEEPAFRRHLDRALRDAQHAGLRHELDVLDVGCGTGVVHDLLMGTAALADGTFTLARYTGLDLDEDLLDVARDRLGGPDVRFVRAAMQDAPGTGPHDLIISSGVPYSHLEADGLRETLAHLLHVALGEGRATLIVVDVLGRYSLEWTTQWDHPRWDYRMSFFATDEHVTSTPMTTWSGSELSAVIAAAAADAKARVVQQQLVDRSLAVGRHTMTGEYTPGLPRLRDGVDALADAPPGGTLDEQLRAELRIDLVLPHAPADVLAHHARFTTAWNAALEAGATDGPALAQRLRAIEADHETAGLGVGHSLTAFTLVERA